MTDATHHRRWLCITPGRCVGALFVVECLLYLSEKFQWFAFNESRGWTVVLANGVVGVFAIFMIVWYLTALLLHVRFQFGLSSLLALFVVVSLPLSWLATEIRNSKRQRDAVAAIGNLGGKVHWSDELGLWPNNHGPFGLESLIGNTLFRSPTTVAISKRRINDATMARIGLLRDLRMLEFYNCDITDRKLRHLAGLSHLNWLIVTSGQLHDDGMTTIARFKELYHLSLCDADITDSGIAAISGLTALRSLHISCRRITDAGLPHLSHLVNLEILSLNNTKVTSAGLESLLTLTKLNTLYLNCSHVSDNGLAQFTRLPLLRELGIDCTDVTDEGVKQLRQTLPNCKIHYRQHR